MGHEERKVSRDARRKRREDKRNRPFGLPSEDELTALTEKRFLQIREQRAQDVKEGDIIAQREFGEGALGRVSEDRSEEVADLISRREQQADIADATARGERVSPVEEAAQRALDIQAQTSLRQLRGQLGAQGIKGGVNLLRQSEVLGGRQQAEASLQAQLAQQRQGQQEIALSGLESAIGGAREDEFTRQQENQKRALQERLGRITLPLQFAQLGATERSAASQEIRASAQTRAQLRAQVRAQATADKAANVSPAESGGISIICGELNRQGLLSDEIYSGDLEFAKTIDLNTLKGYWHIATPIVKMMKVSKFITFAAYVIANGWATEMAFRVGKAKRGSLIGKILLKTLAPMCQRIGKFITKLGVA